MCLETIRNVDKRPTRRNKRKHERWLAHAIKHPLEKENQINKTVIIKEEGRKEEERKRRGKGGKEKKKCNVEKIFFVYELKLETYKRK